MDQTRCFNTVYMVFALNVWPNRPGQTMITLKELSDQGLHCLPLQHYIFTHLRVIIMYMYVTYISITLANFWQTILIKYHTLFFSKISKDVTIHN